MPDSAPIPPALVPIPAEPAAAATLPFAAHELQRSWRQPQRFLEIVLAERARLVASIGSPVHRLALVIVLLVCSIVFALPFGAVLGLRKTGDVAMLFLGSVLICFPSLQVFSSYLGVKLSIAQNLATALVVPAAAALFCFGFFPIHWFLEATMAKDSALGAADIAIGLLSISLLLGLAHLNRCLFDGGALRELRSSRLLLLGWQALLLFITWRMASVLGIVR